MKSLERIDLTLKSVEASVDSEINKAESNCQSRSLRSLRNSFLPPRFAHYSYRIAFDHAVRQFIIDASR